MDSFYWSATTYPNTTYTYYFNFGSTSVVPSRYDDRFYGFSVRGGSVHLNTGSLRSASVGSYYSSNTTYPNATYAYGLNFGSTNIYSSHYNNRFNGFSVRGGYINLSSGSLRNAGGTSYYWSSTTYFDTTYTYDLAFDSTNIYQSNYHSRFNGFSVQCLYAAGMSV